MKKFIEKLVQLPDILLKQPAVKWVFLPFCLLILWLILSLTYSSYRSFTVLQYAHYENKTNIFFDKHLFIGNKLSGDFYANDNHLGIIAIRMGEIPKVQFESEDILLFRIKEKGTDHWLYTNFFRSGGMSSNDYYPFGFNEIDKSKDKEYIFELISERGNTKNAIHTKHSNPIYITKYKFSKKEIAGNPALFIYFMRNKIVTFITNYDLLLSSFVFFLPFLFYIIWILVPNNSIKWISKKYQKQINNKKIQEIIAYIFILYDVIFFEYINIGFMLGLLALWIGVIIVNKQKSDKSFKFALALFLISLLSIYFHLGVSYDKASDFAYFLLVIGVVQNVIEYKKLIH